VYGYLSPIGDIFFHQQKNKKMAKESHLKIRDKQITIRRFISEVGSLLSREGFKGIGVNAVAREAGMDKVVIYRYFGGLTGLIEAYGKEGDLWPSALELAGGDIKNFSQLSLSDRLSSFAGNFINRCIKGLLHRQSWHGK
jgi:AcrR family transcriptional regulator